MANGLKLPVEISLDEAQRLFEIFEVDPTGTDAEGLQAGLARAALAEYLLMISGTRNPTTIRDLRELRLQLLAHHLPHHLPSDRQIAEIFQLTQTQARTLVGGTRARYRKEFEKLFTEAARNALRNAKKPKQGTVRIEASDSLAAFLNEIIQRAAPPTKRPDASHRYDVSSDTLEELCELLDLPIAEVASRRSGN